MNRNQMMRAAPRGFVPQRGVPQGAPQGAFAGYQPGMVPGMVPYAPQGADEGALAGCGNPGLGTPFAGPGMCGPSPFMGLPNILAAQCYRQPCSLLGIVVTPTSAGSTTLEVTCGSSMFYGYCGRSFNDPLVYGFTRIESGGDFNRICDGLLDVAYFNTTDCCCPFDFGCFNNSQPLLLTFAPISTLSVLPPFDFVIGGEKLVNFGCPPFPCYPPGYLPPGGNGWGQPGVYQMPPGNGGSAPPVG